MGDTFDRHVEMCFVKSGYVLGIFPSVVEDYVKDGKFMPPERGFVSTTNDF